MRVLVLFVCVLTLGLATVATANIPDLQQSTAATTYHAGGGTQAVTLYVLPDGSGSVFSAARLADGSIANGTVTLYLRNSVGGGIENFPKEDLLLASVSGTMTPCDGAGIPDSDTDVNGMTQWADPMHAGGNSEALCQVLVGGFALTSSAGMDLHFNSGDISGDLVVDLIDLGNFATGLQDGYSFRCDFVFDGVLDLSDIGRMALATGLSCN